MLRTTHKQTKREILLPKCLLNALKPEKIRIMFTGSGLLTFQNMIKCMDLRDHGIVLLLI